MDQKGTALQLDMIQRPSLCKEICDEAWQQGVIQDQPNQPSHVPLRPVGSPSKLHRAPALCTCTLTRPPRSQRPISRNISAFWATMSSHISDCPLFAVATRTDVLQLSLSFCNVFLRSTIQATASLTRGAGSFSISPRLNFRTH